MATRLYQQILAFNYGDTERSDLMKEVWQGTPWMLDAYTGHMGDSRERDMLHWCYDTFGEQAFPIHGRPGVWQRGGATIHGWTWFGFSNESDMQRFKERWPTPEGVREPVEASALADANYHS